MTMSIKNIRVLRAPVKFQSPIRRASDTWDWLSPEDIVRTALAAYYATCRRMERLAASDGNTDSIDRTVFAGDMYEYFALKVQADGFKKGVCEYWTKAEGKLREIDLYPERLSIDGGQK